MTDHFVVSCFIKRKGNLVNIKTNSLDKGSATGQLLLFHMQHKHITVGSNYRKREK